MKEESLCKDDHLVREISCSGGDHLRVEPKRQALVKVLASKFSLTKKVPRDFHRS